MPQFSNGSVDGPGGNYSLTKDPSRPIEMGRVGRSKANNIRSGSLAVGDSLIIRTAGSGYTDATNVATTNVTAANNSYIFESANGGGTTQLSVDITTFEGHVTSCVVNTVPVSQHNSGCELTVNGGSTLCVIMIP